MGQYEGGTASIGTGYKIRVKQIGAPISDVSNGTFNITFVVVAHIEEGIRILSPARGDRIRNSTRATIRWRMPSSNACGDKVDLFVKKVGTSFDYKIKQNENCNPGENSYLWLVHTPDFTGTPADFKIKIVSSSGCSKESDPFQIVSYRDSSSETRSDYLIDSVILSNGLSLNHGLNYTAGNNISNTFQVNVKWNKTESSSAGSHSVQVTSVLTGDTIHLANNPAHFSFEDAHSRTGVIRILVPFSIAHSKVESMIRGRFIPLSFRLVFNPSACDSFAPNNNEEFNLRILDAPRVVNFIAKIDENSLFVKTKRSMQARHDRLEFRVTIKVRNLVMPSSPVQNVKCHYVIKWWVASVGRWEHLYPWDNYLVFKSVRCDEWTTRTIEKEFSIHKNVWTDLYFVINVDRDKKFNDPYRSNNEAQLIFKKPPK